MNPREVLGLPEGPLDLATLKRAYAVQLRLHRPTSDPEGFRRVRDAYEALSGWLAEGASDSGTDPWDGARDATCEIEIEQDAKPPGPSEVDPVAAEVRDIRNEGSAAPEPPQGDGARPPIPRKPAAPAPGIEATLPPPPHTPATSGQAKSADSTARPSPGLDAQGIMAAWIRGQESTVLAAIASLGRAGDAIELGRLARQCLADVRVGEGPDPERLWVTLARLLAFVDPKIARRLADAAWAQASPSERSSLDLHGIDLRVAAARDVASWPIETGRILVRIAGGAVPPRKPWPPAWVQVLSLVRTLPPDSALLRWLALEGRGVVKAAGGHVLKGSVRWHEPSKAKPWWSVWVYGLGVAVTLVLFSVLRARWLPNWNARFTLPDRSLGDWKESEVAPITPLERQALAELDALFPPPGPNEAQARSLLVALAREGGFRLAWQTSARVRERVRALRTLYLPADEALLDDPALGVPEAGPR